MLPDKMKALMAYAPGDYRLEIVDTPRARPGEIILRIEACGICAGDLKSYHGAARFWGGEGQPRYIISPMIPGHEFIGFVEELGEGVKGFEIGDRVVSEQIVPCNECRFCKSGRYWMCQPHDVFGFKTNVNGGMAQYVRLPANAINYKVPKHIPMEKAVLIEPFACSKHCIDRAPITNTDIVVLAGAGTLGLGMVGCIRLRNPKALIVLDLNDKRLALARQFGADYTLNPRKDDVTGLIMDMTDGYGCDVYVEATGHPSAVQQGLDLLRKMGTFVEFSVFGAPATVDWSIISDSKELDVLGVHLSPNAYGPVIEWLDSGRLPADGVLTHTFKLDEWEKAFETAEKEPSAIKVALIP